MNRRIPMAEASPRQTATVEKDVRFFERNPHIRAYERRATKTERKDFDLPPHAIAFVIKVSDRVHIRAFRVGESRN